MTMFAKRVAQPSDLGTKAKENFQCPVCELRVQHSTLSHVTRKGEARLRVREKVGQYSVLADYF